MKTNKPEIEFEASSGNVFADLGLEDADELYLRTALGTQVMGIIQDEGYTQKEAAKLLGIKQSEVSAIMNAKFHRFSQERLIGFLNKLERKVTIHISHHQPGEPYQEVGLA